ncbi:hypothetical protein PR202_ga15079 [Eleusine coracana subsp. coracana]|uniref:Protein kinase domain-containing protein n=1 Tax=Eleusine coracana subsp. coracana TaxID=191504 RepID=A0AAV5CIG6_ELECO|nr:hypothetical protein PR202_ga15079 [Eleusine coracana subsp. coracana]
MVIYASIKGEEGKKQVKPWFSSSELRCLFACCFARDLRTTDYRSTAFGNQTIVGENALKLKDKTLTVASGPAFASKVNITGWTGVACGKRGQRRGHAVGLSLGSLGLVGTISPSISNLTHLRNLHLPHNKFNGRIPHELGLLSDLKHLNLSDNSLEGEIPSELSRCSQLQTISLWYNNLQGRMPSNFSHCSNLRTIEFFANYLEGDIPSDFGSIENLELLNLFDNNLNGSLPPELGNLQNLYLLDISNNALTGFIPPEIAKLHALQYMGFGNNKISGFIPASLGNLSSMTVLSLENNSLAGTIPPSIGNLKNLLKLRLDYNELEANQAADWGFFDALTNSSHLQVLQLSYNRLRGALPNSLSNLSTSLEHLAILENEIGGNIPEGIGKLVNLMALYMGPNLLTGSIPPSLGSLSKLNVISLVQNRLSGDIPSTLGNLTELSQLYLYDNALSGQIPPTLRKCPLGILSLGKNNLTGKIPEEVLLSSTTRSLSVQSNMLTGPIPELGLLRNLQGLQELDLSCNNLSGAIPEFLGSFAGLTYLNLSFNNLTGEVPGAGIFLNASAFSIAGNNGLCGGVPMLNLPLCPTHQSRRKHKFPKLTVILSVLIPVFSLIAFKCLLVLWYWRHRSDEGRSDPTSPRSQLPRVSYMDLSRATNGFSTANLIGEGRFGSVYMGNMNSGEHRVVAVKIFKLQERGASHSFLAECETLRYLRHRNLVKILTVCSTIDPRGHDLKL